MPQLKSQVGSMQVTQRCPRTDDGSAEPERALSTHRSVMPNRRQIRRHAASVCESAASVGRSGLKRSPARSAHRTIKSSTMLSHSHPTWGRISCSRRAMRSGLGESSTPSRLTAHTSCGSDALRSRSSRRQSSWSHGRSRRRSSAASRVRIVAAPLSPDSHAASTSNGRTASPIRRKASAAASLAKSSASASIRIGVARPGSLTASASSAPGSRSCDATSYRPIELQLSVRRPALPRALAQPIVAADTHRAAALPAGIRAEQEPPRDRTRPDEQQHRRLREAYRVGRSRHGCDCRRSRAAPRGLAQDPS